MRPMETSKDFEEFFEALNSNNVRYLVVGGYAFAIHARPRFTEDIDIFISHEESNARRMLRATVDFGFGDAGIDVRDFSRSDQIIQLGYPPLRIDIMTSISGVTFDEAWKNKIESFYGKQKIFFIGKADLIKNKKASGRKKDLADLDELGEKRKGKRAKK